MQDRYQINLGFQQTPQACKKLIIINCVIWLLGVFIFQDIIMRSPIIFHWFGLVPKDVFSNFYFWQPLTYMFLHSDNLLHIFLNMFVLWSLGGDLERLWGSRYFVAYYIFGGVGSALIYLLCLYLVQIWGIGGMSFTEYSIPVIGASGAIFALLLAYGYQFSQKIIYVMFIFPMKAVHFVCILGFFELLSLAKSGLNSSISHLSHLGGLVAGALFFIRKLCLF